MSAKVLIVEDNLQNLELFREILDLKGFEVSTASSAEDGLELMKESRPDLILMDIGLPGMDGLTATRIIKNDPALSGIPIVALTAHAMSGDQERALEAGCDGYLTKPINTRNFPDQVRGFLESGKD